MCSNWGKLYVTAKSEHTPLGPKAAIQNFLLNYIEGAATSIVKPDLFLVQGYYQSSLSVDHAEFTHK